MNEARTIELSRKEFGMIYLALVDQASDFARSIEAFKRDGISTERSRVDLAIITGLLNRWPRHWPDEDTSHLPSIHDQPWRDCTCGDADGCTCPPIS
jgi:hypothetical protein